MHEILTPVAWGQDETAIAQRSWLELQGFPDEAVWRLYYLIPKPDLVLRFAPEIHLKLSKRCCAGASFSFCLVERRVKCAGCERNTPNPYPFVGASMKLEDPNLPVVVRASCEKYLAPLDAVVSAAAIELDLASLATTLHSVAPDFSSLLPEL